MSKVSVVTWQLWVNNSEVVGEKKACITSFSFDELCDGSDTLTINILDPNFEFIEDNIFIDEASVVLEHGFEGDVEREKFSGYISAIDITFPEEGSPALTITCLDKSHIMNRSKKDRSWDNVTRADVVRKIAAEYGFGTYIEPNYEFALQDTISQSKQTDIEFLESLASNEREPFLCKLIGNTIHYEKKGLLSDPVTAVGYKTYPFDVMSFSPQINKETRQEEITVSDVGTENKDYDTYTANDNNVSRDLQGESVKTTSSNALNDSSKDSSNMVYDPVSRSWSRRK